MKIDLSVPLCSSRDDDRGEDDGRGDAKEDLLSDQGDGLLVICSGS